MQNDDAASYKGVQPHLDAQPNCLPNLGPKLHSSLGLFTKHLRDPENVPAPSELDDHRVGIYRELVYNNIESFLRGSFPVLRQVLPDEQWQMLARDFIRDHGAQSPYFLDIPKEFLGFLQTREFSDEWPAFLLELAHYEWVELALDVSVATIPDDFTDKGDVLADIPVLSPLVLNLRYRFPVHLLSAAFQALEPGPEATCLVVYRNRADQVKFMAVNALTSRLVSLLEENNDQSGHALLAGLATEIGATLNAEFLNFGKMQLEQFLRADILAGLKAGA